MQRSLTERLNSDSPHPRIRIALLDSGYDALDPSIRGENNRIVGHCSFEPGASADQDENGHGTHILALLLQYAPLAEIYVARLGDLNDADETDSVAQVSRTGIRFFPYPNDILGN